MAAGEITLLFIDDVPDHLYLLSQMLQTHGYCVEIAADGALGLLLSQTILPDLILLDTHMPIMNGFETCRRLKSDPLTCSIPVIFISSSAEVEDKVRGFAAGGVDYINQPFQMDEVLARIETHLSIRRLQTRLEGVNQELACRLEELGRARAAEHEQRILAETLRDIIAAVNSTLDTEEILDLIFSHLSRVFPHELASIALVDDTGIVQVKRLHGYREKWGDFSFPTSNLSVDDFPGWRKISERQEPLLIVDTLLSSDWFEIPTMALKPPTLMVRSYLCAPILIKGKVIGFLDLGSTIPGFFTMEQAEHLQTFANQMAVAIEKARLFHETKRLAITDELTGICNRRRLFELSDREIERARRYHRPLSMILFDVDHFKQVNDTFGHLVGDQILRLIAQVCQNRIRKVDILGRYGGEEFVILMPETNHSHGIEAAERIRKEVCEMAFLSGKDVVRVTISLGVATTGEGEDLSLNALIKRADDALHKAKTEGRNRVCCFDGTGEILCNLRTESLSQQLS